MMEKVIEVNHSCGHLNEAFGVSKDRFEAVKKKCIEVVEMLNPKMHSKTSEVLENIWNDNRFTIEEHILITFSISRDMGVMKLLNDIPYELAEVVMTLSKLKRMM